MDNKLSELSKPVAWRYRYTKPGITDSDGEAWVGDWKFVTDEVNCNPAPNYQRCALYSQEYVSALLAELEEKDTPKDIRVAEIEKRLKQRAEEMERILEGITPEMIAGGWTAKGISDYAKSLEAKLATPVRLPVVLMGYQSDDYRIGFMEGVEKSGDEVRAAGFTVDGDE
ncbi:hypothetical protein [Serratia marcescens]|uniref:hypothetical protein n=1 Tax=Serratia marcescens TaxID=615 RepID=UPI0027E4917E|nr:hypothetical protein [Serratia marcescens]MDI3227759.1 hypothetical protein [Serratia marcescens]HEN7340841.1 hypothetical protein [Serratia marcescens]HEN7411583.1 hypothetical protein [Serratia marcescens]